MKKLVLSAALLAASGIFFSAFRKSAPASLTTTNAQNVATKWVLDKSHSNIRFTVTHMVVSEAEGSFKSFDGTFVAEKADFSDAKINFTIDVNSINTDNENRDKHLKGDDFFNAEKFPQIKFESTAFKPQGGNKYKLEGNLTVRDITKPVSFDVTYGGTIASGRGAKAGFKAKTSIDRFEFGLKWNRMTEAGGLAVGKDVEVTVNIELNEAKQ
ncbi:YceI family protein [Pseudobacter ginsenosidimutans]|uniref:Polyisoprenoid-binding protein YceI n=1 Tax=Pseudobacter ginsenosidimutans TaxID=661488 RepID=A0A4Q7MSN2_9BACT|nr:YceI family protein [Pseudobacter ginsenosidimutans]QEC41605.1 YceI family protein [Pseudobacter ginsenosidimutans]RZS71607.1 polyisoprenoid-binding protein YceI [Pseudobacter ginsenosidimutans]